MPKLNRDYYEGLLNNPNVQAYLLMIRKGEGTPGPNGYSTHYGGGSIETLNRNPKTSRTWTAGKYISSAVGAFQFLNTLKHPTWPNIVARFGFKDFSPHNQDIGALSLIDEKGALPDIINGDIVSAIEKTKGVWASLPGSKYGQPTQKLTDALAFYQKHGGVIGKVSVQSKQDRQLTNGSYNQLTKIPGYKPMLISSGKALPGAESKRKQRPRPSAGLAEHASKNSIVSNPVVNVFKYQNSSPWKVFEKAKSAEPSSALSNFKDTALGKPFLTSQVATKMIAHLSVPRFKEGGQTQSHFDGTANKAELNVPLFANTWAVPKLSDERNFLYPTTHSAIGAPIGRRAAYNLQHVAMTNPVTKVMNTLEKSVAPLEVSNVIRGSFKDTCELKRSSTDLLLPTDKNERSQEMPMSSAPDTSRQGTNSVNINLNKPLIDGFSIIVTTAAEGIDDLKGKVEDALLEILNSANAI